jgi:APA family basic amino acid/polyamine antiporter
MGIYLLVNLAYLRVLTIGEIQASTQIGVTVAERSLGAWGGALVRATILLAILGSVNGICLTASRLYYAQAKDGLFLPTLDRLDAKRNTPMRAIGLHAILSCAMLLVGNLGNLLQLAIFAAWLYYFIAVLGLARLRRTRPDLPRPYRMWGYPVTPALFLAGSGYFLVSLFLQNAWPALVVFALLAVSFPIARRLEQSKAQSKSAGSASSLA